MSVLVFRYKEIWFGERPCDVSGFDRVIFRECRAKQDVPGFQRSDFTTLVIDTGQDLDTLWKAMSHSNCRKPINRAIKSGVTVKVDQRYEEFAAINRKFRKDKGLDAGLLSIDYMKRYGTLFVTEYDGQVLSGLFCLRDNERMMQLYTGSKRLEAIGEDQNFIGNANKLMIWESIRYAKEHGIEEYDWGGYYTGVAPDPQKEQINVFKKRFGGEIATRYNYLKNYSIPLKLLTGIRSLAKA